LKRGHAPNFLKDQEKSVPEVERESEQGAGKGGDSPRRGIIEVVFEGD